MPAVCALLDLPFIADLTQIPQDPALLRALTPEYARTQAVFPAQSPGGASLIILADPANSDLAREITVLLGRPVAFAGTTSAALRAAHVRIADPEEKPAEAPAPLARDAEALRQSSIEGPVVRYVQNILTDAELQGASDLHFEATETGHQFRLRLNGILHPCRTDQSIPATSIAARLKVMANMNVAERRLPQDGRFDSMIAGRKIDFRLSSLPTQWGESIVCRVLDPRALRLGWDELGFPPDISAQVRALLDQPHGLFLVTGPTGSGKTTTLYTAVATLNTPGRKIVTVEDPVEYNLPGIQQIQVHDSIGLSFGRVLRGVLRHDPDVILIGEIRDQETAEIAARAAQVGRLVLSTLHTNSPAGAVQRLVDLGVPEFLVRDVLRGVLGQTLTPVFCGECGGRGCDGCGGSGVVRRKVEVGLWLPATEQS